MIIVQEFLLGFSIISLLLYILRALNKSIITMVLSNDYDSPSSSHPHLSWVSRFFVNRRGGGGGSIPENLKRKATHVYGGDILNAKFSDKMCQEEDIVHENLGVLCSETVDARAEEKGKYANGNTKQVSGKLRMRPARLIVPEYWPGLVENEVKKVEEKEIEIEGRDYFLASKKGRRDVMEDGYGVLIDISGDPKQAFFSVIDGHGGRDAADYVAANLGKNIVKGLEKDQSEQAIRGGYLVTDKEFLSKGVTSGACAASVLLKDGELHVANVGDCRVVLSRKGVADTLTNDHRLCREDERSRIENSGGYVNCRNGVWRVHGTLAISRAIGDMHLKEWVIPEPEIKKLRLTSDCEFLIMASDGLWDKVNDQEAVDVVSSDKNTIESCKKLVDVSFCRGNMDDITVMVINLENFVACA